jgi:predicted  nucleic acid-binding Zn-ribbon protein
MFKGENMYYSLEIIGTFTSLVQSSPEFALAASSSFAENGFSTHISTFLTRTSRREHHTDLRCSISAPCPVYVKRCQILRDIALCKLTLQLGFTSSSFFEKLLLTTTLDNLGHLSAELSMFTCQCKPKEASFLALLEELSTPSVIHPSLQWRESIANDLLRDAHTKYNSIVNTVGTVCRNLEDRCATVEQPLRKAEEVIENLKRRHEDVERQKAETEERCGLLINEIEGLRSEKEAVMHDLHYARCEIDAGRHELMDAKERHRMQIDEERGRWHEREEELIRTNRILDEELKEAHSSMTELKDQVNPSLLITNDRLLALGTKRPLSPMRFKGCK